MKLKGYGMVYVLIFLVAVVVNVVLLLVYDKGPQASRDFRIIYEPTAARIVEYIKGNVDSTNIGETVKDYPSLLFHLGYVVFAALFFLLFGTGNITAIVLFQILISALIPVLIFKIARDAYTYPGIAFLVTFVSIIFIDNLVFNNWATPESLFRFLFFVSYYYLLKLFYVEKNHQRFFLVVLATLPLLSFIRIDAVVLFLPLYALLSYLILRKISFVRRVYMALTIVSVIVLLFLYNLPYMVKLGKALYVNGDVIIQFTKIEPFDYTLGDNYLYLINRGLKLYSLRAYQFLNIFPPFWSKGHQLYYGAHMILFYLFSIAAFIRIWRTKDWYFSFYLFVFVSSLILHILTRVDAALRTNYTHLPFLILSAGYGLDFAVNELFKYKAAKAGKQM